MKKHDIFGPLEDTKAEAAKAAEIELHEVIHSLRECLVERNSSLFSVEELGKLIIPYDPTYAQQYKEWLLRIKKRADSGILGGKSSVIRETS